MDTNIARERISYVVKPDSITASQGDFLATHVALTRLHLLSKFDVLPSGGKDYTEENLYQRLILNPENRHQFIAVYGQSGTGKSHLIRWFEAKFSYDKPDNEVVLFIRRSDNTLKGTIRQLLSTPEVQEIANKDIYDRLVRATVYEDESKLKGRIYHDFINEVEHDDEDHGIVLTNVKRKRLTAFLYNEIVQSHLMAADGPFERIYSKIAENSSVDRDTVAQFLPRDFAVSADLFEDIHRAGADPKAEKMARELMANESGVDTAKQIADYLNQFVNDVIQRCAGIEPGDFRDIFQDIRRELYRIGKNLTLFIEDVTSFTGVDDALLDALIVEHTGMNAGENLCRISSIVGTTSNYLQNNFRDNHKDRITQYIYIPSDVFDENGIFEFVGRYINTMSLTETAINGWLQNHATLADYPVHEVKEGCNWDYISIDAGKKLCLYPFTKNSITYLYKHALRTGHQTPRYIIRDIIEPVVRNVLNDADNFPSIKFDIVNVNTTLSILIHNQVKNEAIADRLLRVLSIWGNGKPEQYSENGIVYISAVRKEILEELGLPLLNVGNRVPPVKPEPPVQPGSPVTPLPPVPGPISASTQEKVNKAIAYLTQWTKEKTIDASVTVGSGGIVRAALEDICAFLMSAVNWQLEGISSDNITKIKASSVKLVTLAGQAKIRTPGFYVMQANWESLNIMGAFIRWREYGTQSWNYPDSSLDAFLVTSWAAKIKGDLIKAVSEYTISDTSYIEAAIAAEMYRLILCGEFRERSLKNLTVRNLFEEQASQKSGKTSHTKEWNSLVSLLSQKGSDVANRETVRQYFNLPQGLGGSQIVLDEPNLMHFFRKVKTNKLIIADDAFEKKDIIKLRQNAFDYLKDIYDRIDNVAKAERDNARTIIQIIYDHFDGDEIDEDDIIDLAIDAKSFYDEINNTMLAIQFFSSEQVKKNAKQIAKAINDIGEVLDEKDPLTTIMTFSGDPVSALVPLMDLLNRLDADIIKVDKLVADRNANLGELGTEVSVRYAFETKTIDSCFAMLGMEAQE